MKMSLLISFLLCSIYGFSQENVKPKKMSYSDYTKDFAIDDTATVIIDLFFDRRDNGAYGEMVFLPITAGLVAIPQTRNIGAVLSLISLPMFIHGCFILVKYRRAKLYKVLSDYKNSKELPKWIQRKVDKQLGLYKVIDREY